MTQEFSPSLKKPFGPKLGPCQVSFLRDIRSR